MRILSLSENADKADNLSPLYIQYPGNRVFLKPGDTISAEDFDKVRWDAMNSEGGSFRFMPVDAQGADVPGWTAQTVTVREYPDYPDYPEAPPTHVVPQDAMLALPATVFAAPPGQQPGLHPDLGHRCHHPGRRRLAPHAEGRRRPAHPAEGG